jgi:exodeoxyribonuclease VII large subunit
LVGATRTILGSHRVAVDGLRQRLQVLGPMAVLQRGYVLALADGDRIMRSIDDFRPGTEFTLRLKDGRVRARAESQSEEV